MRPGIDQLTAAGIKRDVAERWLPHVQQALDRFGIASERQVAAWLAQTAHESGGYTMLVENLNYRASTMAACWPARFGVKNADGTWAKDDKGARVPNKFALALERKLKELRKANDEVMNRVDTVKRIRHTANYSQRLAALGAAQ